jgi:DNA-binding response OmpR family regulator
VSEKGNAPRAQRARKNGSPRTLRVLVVDGDMDVTDELTARLDSSSTMLLHADTLVEANMLLRIHQTDLAVIATHLADGSGLELADRLHRQWPDTQILVTTRRPTVARMLEAVRAGASDIMIKPLQCDEMFDRVQQATDRYRANRANKRRVRRLKRACRKLNDARIEVSEQVNVLCGDLVSAYQDLASQMQQVASTSEFATLIRQELDLEQLLHTTLEYVLQKAGPTNAAIFLPTNTDEYTLGGYINYDCSSGAADVLMQGLADRLVPKVADREDVLYIADDNTMARWVGEDAEFLEQAHLMAISCRHQDETLAVLAMFRNRAQPFDDKFVETCTLIAPILGESLGRLFRIYHRHLPPNDDPGTWGFAA